MITLIQLDEDATATTRDENQSATRNLTISLSEVFAWALVSILTVVFTVLLIVVLLWMLKKRQKVDRDTNADNSTPKYEMEGNPCYETTGVNQTTDTHLYETVRGLGRGAR